MRRRKSSGKRASQSRDENAENDQRQALKLINQGKMNKDLVVGGESINEEKKTIKGQEAKNQQVKRI